MRVYSVGNRSRPNWKVGKIVLHNPLSICIIERNYLINYFKVGLIFELNIDKRPFVTLNFN